MTLQERLNEIVLETAEARLRTAQHEEAEAAARRRTAELMEVKTVEQFARLRKQGKL